MIQSQPTFFLRNDDRAKVISPAKSVHFTLALDSSSQTIEAVITTGNPQLAYDYFTSLAKAAHDLANRAAAAIKTGPSGVA